MSLMEAYWLTNLSRPSSVHSIGRRRSIASGLRFGLLVSLAGCN